MPVVVSPYNHTAKKLLNKEVNYATIKVELLNASGVFNAGHAAKTNVDNAGAWEVYGNGWTQGGIALANVAITTVDTNDAMIDADDVEVTAVGGTIGPAENALIYDATGNVPLLHISFGRSHDAGQTTAFKIVWNSLGLLRGLFA